MSALENTKGTTMSAPSSYHKKMIQTTIIKKEPYFLTPLPTFKDKRAQSSVAYDVSTSACLK